MGLSLPLPLRATTLACFPNDWDSVWALRDLEAIPCQKEGWVIPHKGKRNFLCTLPLSLSLYHPPSLFQPPISSSSSSPFHYLPLPSPPIFFSISSPPFPSLPFLSFPLPSPPLLSPPFLSSPLYLSLFSPPDIGSAEPCSSVHFRASTLSKNTRNIHQTRTMFSAGVCGSSKYTAIFWQRRVIS